MSSTNIRGLNNTNKQETKLNHILDHLDSDVKIIIDAHANENTVNNLKKDFKLKLAKYNITGNYSKERGILILSNKTSGYEISNLELLDQTSTLRFDLTTPGGEKFSLVAIYAPDGTDNAYWTQLHKKLEEKPREKQILMGDFNTTLNPDLDRQNYQTDAHGPSRKIINEWINNDKYIDAFRYIYPERRDYTWRWDGNRKAKKEKKEDLITVL